MHCIIIIMLFIFIVISYKMLTSSSSHHGVDIVHNMNCLYKDQNIKGQPYHALLSCQYQQLCDTSDTQLLAKLSEWPW